MKNKYILKAFLISRFSLKIKKILSLIVVVHFSQFAVGQIATIQDQDGWTNVRKSPNAQSEIIYRIYENEVFWYDFRPADKLQEWVSISIPKDAFSMSMSEADYLVGFIHKSRLLPLDNMKEYIGPNFTFKYYLSDFNPFDKIIEKQEDGIIFAIDGRPIWGTDGNMPRTEVKKIEVEVDGKRINIHKVFYSDLFECTNSFSVLKNGDTFYVYQWNSDGAGAYEMVWVIDHNGLQQRFISQFY